MLMIGGIAIEDNVPETEVCTSVESVLKYITPHCCLSQ